MMTSPIVNKAAAHQRMTHHQFLPGIGYLAHGGAPDVPAGIKGGRNCKPPSGTRDGSVHLLRSAHHGSADKRFRWVAAEGAWASLKPAAGNRLAWTAEHLSAAGWEYSGPAEAEGSRRRRA